MSKEEARAFLTAHKDEKVIVRMGEKDDSPTITGIVEWVGRYYLGLICKGEHGPADKKMAVRLGSVHSCTLSE